MIVVQQYDENEEQQLKKKFKMIYIISGTSRSGKTLIAQKMMKQYEIPYVSLDWLVMGFTNGIPEYGINDKLWPNEIAEKFWDFLNAMCENMIWSETDYIIEGEAILPKLINVLLKKYPDKIKICFIGYTNVKMSVKVKDVYHHSNGKNDWLTNESKEYTESHIVNMIEYSKMIKKTCEEYEIKYFDTSENFLQTIDNVIKYLTKNKE
jgi:adenylate kinase family enzyme